MNIEKIKPGKNLHVIEVIDLTREEAKISQKRRTKDQKLKKESKSKVQKPRSCKNKGQKISIKIRLGNPKSK